jgi:SAM-dependent methyltransferase
MPPMDAYTEETRAWLDRRFAETAPDGVYVAHQPIYGFDAGHCEPSLLPRYVRTLEIMRALAQLRFRSCLDAGAAEGYKAELVRRLFGAEVVATDLSETACQRAREIFGLEAQAGDVHDLPFDDDRFDVSLCSETLEHVSDFRSALAELLRVSRVGVVITVPHESQERVEENRDSGEPHAHINSFSLDSLDYLEREQGLRVIARPIVSPLTAAAAGLVEGSRRELREPAEKHRTWNRLARVNNAIAPLTARAFGPRAESALLELDGPACRRLRAHRALLYVVLKDRSAWLDRPARRVTAREIVSFRVPFHWPSSPT